ncbi:MAG: hypothetical protein QXT39_03090 [Conexivisphaerales archaeon]
MSLHQFSSSTPDVVDRLMIGDLNGASLLLGLTVDEVRRKEKELHLKIRRQERRAIKTSDARKIKQDILSIFIEEACSPLTKSLFMTLTPSMDRSELTFRFDSYVEGRMLYELIKESGELEDIRKNLREFYFEYTDDKGVHSPIVKYMLARRRILRVIDVLSSYHSIKDVADFKLAKSVTSILMELEKLELKDISSAIFDAELLINDEIKKQKRLDEARLRSIIEDTISRLSGELQMNAEEETMLRSAAFGSFSLPFEFDKAAIRKLVSEYSRRQQASYERSIKELEGRLKQSAPQLDEVIKKFILLDKSLTIAIIAERYGLKVPVLGNDGIGFINGKNFFLLKDSLSDNKKEVQAITYSIGKTKMLKMTQSRNVVMLTGANSGGKTTLLTTVATIHIMCLLGFPVPCERAEVTPMPIYLFRRRVTKKIGSLEHALRSLIPVFSDSRRKIVLMDEFEALTEPGAAGKILATIINKAVTSSSIVLLVTHLAKETLPYVKLPIRVDGIEAKGLDSKGELLVDRQPIFNHIGSSTPKLVIMKLSKTTRNKKVRLLYEELLASLGEDKASLQAPISFPWLEEH